MPQQASTQVLQLQGRRYSIFLSSTPNRLLLTHRPGHQTSECKANRVFDTSGVADMSAEDAWDALQKADEKRDLDDFREVRPTKAIAQTTD